LVAKPEGGRLSSFGQLQTDMRHAGETEPEWTARERGWQLSE